jgi:hypothetical protein
MIVVVSTQANNSLHVSREIELADHRNIPVIPVRVEECDLSDALHYRLSNRQALYAYGPESNGFENRLVSVLGSQAAAKDIPASPGFRTNRWLRTAVLCGVIAALIFGLNWFRPRDYHLYDHVREARWTNGTEDLPWQTEGKFELGVAADASKSVLEHGKAEARTIHMHPQWINDGAIWGHFALRKPIRRGDRFRADVGFQSNQHIVGEVDFIVLASGPGVETKQFGPFHKRHEGRLEPVDIDLTPAAQATKISLFVGASGSSAQDWAVWVDPRIESKGWW